MKESIKYYRSDGSEVQELDLVEHDRQIKEELIETIRSLTEKNLDGLYKETEQQDVMFRTCLQFTHKYIQEILEGVAKQVNEMEKV